VLASVPSLEHGFARELLLQWAGLPANAVVFTQGAAEGTLAAALVERARADGAAGGRPAAGLPGAAAGPGRPGLAPGLGGGGGGGAKPLVLELQVARRVPLEGVLPRRGAAPCQLRCRCCCCCCCICSSIDLLQALPLALVQAGGS
jgi:hypothetical protein